MFKRVAVFMDTGNMRKRTQMMVRQERGDL